MQSLQTEFYSLCFPLQFSSLGSFIGHFPLNAERRTSPTRLSRSSVQLLISRSLMGVSGRELIFCQSSNSRSQINVVGKSICSSLSPSCIFFIMHISKELERKQKKKIQESLSFTFVLCSSLNNLRGNFPGVETYPGSFHYGSKIQIQSRAEACLQNLHIKVKNKKIKISFLTLCISH